MKKQYEVDEHLVRSGARIRESVRCLPRGHFQQIRQMFDKQNSKVYLHQLPVTDDEKLQQRTNIDDIIFEDDQHFSTGKISFFFFLFSNKKNKCNHLIECQRPVLSLFIKHQGSIIKQ